MIFIDGSMGEGGGQVLRTSLSLSLVSGRGFRIENIRARRRKPGLMRQHLTAVRAAAEISGARVHGDELGSTKLVFEPGELRPDDYEFAVGTAGSTVLVLQTILPPLLLDGAPSSVTVEGGTHNMKAPVFEFLEHAFGPQLEGMGAGVSFGLEQHGFYPAGGGRLRAELREPIDKSAHLELVERGELLRIRATSLIAHLPEHVASRELEALEAELSVGLDEARIVDIAQSRSPGNTLVVEVESERVTEVFTAIGQKGIRAEEVAKTCSDAVNAYLESGAPVGPHLADQLLVPMAITSGGVFRTSQCTRHTDTQLGLIPRFVDARLERHDEDGSSIIRVEV
ncbi:MAG: RNA 3'-terminal phosphate cyclase [Persicimonas sp.]